MVLILTLALAGAPPPIVNGEKTDDYPEVVLLRHTTADGSVAFVCSGTLVAPDAVLTAAHCLADVEGYDLTDIRVFSGAVWTQAAPERQADRWEQHPDYFVSADGSEIVADLGVILLDEPYAMDGYPLNADPLTEADVGTRFRWVGWGASGDDATDSGYFKRAVDMPLYGLEGEFLLGYDGEDGGATCGGDSGGAVFELAGSSPTALIGVHSFGRDDDGTICAGSISGDTRVDLYLEWIIEQTGARTDAPTPADGDAGECDECAAVDQDDDDGVGCVAAPGPDATCTVVTAAIGLGRRRAQRDGRHRSDHSLSPSRPKTRKGASESETP